MIPDHIFLERLAVIVGHNQILQGDQLSGIASSFWDPTQLQARALVRPGSTREVAAIMALCYELEQPVVVRGGLTGPVGGAVAASELLAISLERMTAMEPVDSVNSCFVVDAGTTLQAAQEHAARSGHLLALDLGARGSCTIGGNIATNAGGINVLRYGMARNQVLGIEAVLADGTIVSSMAPMLKANTGYDLNQLFIGTEGTIGIVTRAILRLHPLPRSAQTALVALERFDDVIGLLNLLKSRLAERLSAFEVMWSEYFLAQTAPGQMRSPLGRDHQFYVVVECQGFDEERDAAEFLNVLQSGLEGGLVADAVVASSERERKEIWDLRENLDAVLHINPVYLYDVAVPMDRMADYVDAVMIAVRQRWPQSQCFAMGHIADGNIHFFVRPNQGGTDQTQSDDLVYDPLIEIGGLISAEHGIGSMKKGWLARNRPPEYLAAMRRIKSAFDPKALLNPGCIFDPIESAAQAAATS